MWPACYTLPVPLILSLRLFVLPLLLLPSLLSSTPAMPSLPGQDGTGGPPAAHQSLAPSASEALLLRHFEDKYRHAIRLQVTFLQRYYENGRVVRIEAGDAYFLRPGKMRWDYQAPEKNTFVVDGKYAWFYAPADHTATRMPAKRSDDWRTPLAFLTSHMKLSQLCSKVEVAPGARPSQSANSVFRCIFNKSADSASSPVGSVFLELSPEGDLDRIMIPQEGGRKLEFSFTAWKWNPVLDASVFQFVPPPDAVIVDGLLPDTHGLRQ
jgi:outer membrane lipoprotein carrier protein